MKIDFSPPDISDIEVQLVTQALASGWITTGPKTKELEHKLAGFCGVSRAVCLNSATAAMELTLRVLGIGAGDEVITSAYTYTASASVIHHVGAKIVLVDTTPDSYEMDYERLAGSITNKTKAIIVVDIAGVPCDYTKIIAAIESRQSLFSPKTDIQKALGRVAIIADAAHSLGATRDGKPAGALADFASYSFHAVKNLTTAEGGAVVWSRSEAFDCEELYREYMLYSLHGQSKDALAKTTLGAWEYDILRLGYKCNMTDIAAAIGLGQLSRYKDILDKRKQIIATYDNTFVGTKIKSLRHYNDDYQSSGHLYLTRVVGISEKERNSIISKLAVDGIATNVHYKPLPMFSAYKNLGFCITEFPNAYNQYCNQISLPLHTKLTAVQIEYIIEKYLKAIEI